MAPDAPPRFDVVVKSDCPTCQVIVPVLVQMERAGLDLQIHYQDDDEFLQGLEGVRDDTSLERSFQLAIDTVPTLVRTENGGEAGRAVGWVRSDWEDLTGLTSLGPDLDPWKPGCGSKSVTPG
ncbi:MAG: thioredoxin, partial [Gemmatimonadetes bacterium]|nr:thioredoxin [Gemmatimonadota bacterium]